MGSPTASNAAFLNNLIALAKYNPTSTNQAPYRRYVVTPSNTTDLDRMCGCFADLARNTTTQHGQCASFLSSTRTTPLSTPWLPSVDPVHERTSHSLFAPIIESP